jgi:uncharacterized phage protein gp47/JayE
VVFQIPTLLQSVMRARAAFRANLAGTDAWLWPNNVNPTAKVIGQLTNQAFGFADYIQRQKFAITADGENLDLHGAEINLGRLPASPSSGPVTLTFAAAVAVAVGAIFQRSDGVQFSATAASALATAGTLNIPVICTTTGLSTVTIPGTALSPISGVTGAGAATATAVVGTGGLTGGADVEQDGAYLNPAPGTYRYRILFKKRNPPAGGAPADYVTWCTEAGATRVFVEPRWLGAGTIRVFVLMDNTYANGIPQSGDIARIQAFVDTVAPGEADITIAAPIAVPIDVLIGTLNPNNGAVRNAILAELAATFLRRSSVAGTATPNPAMPFLATAQSFFSLWISGAIDNAAGVLSADIVGLADQALTDGQIATLGTVTFPS